MVANVQTRHSRFSASIIYRPAVLSYICVVLTKMKTRRCIHIHTTRSTRWRGKTGHRREVLCLKTVFISSPPTVKKKIKKKCDATCRGRFFFCHSLFQNARKFRRIFCVDDFFFFFCCLFTINKMPQVYYTILYNIR